MRSCSRPKTKRGFTVAEILVTIAVLMLILMTVAQFAGQIDGVWKSTASDPFIEAQNAFDSMARSLASATLEPYQDYADAKGAFRSGNTFVPDHLARRSDLAFVCGNSLLSGRTTTGSGVFFVAPQGSTRTGANQGLSHLLNAMGYFVEFGDDTSAPGFSTSHRWRWRLRQVTQASETLQIFSNTTSSAWLKQLAPSSATFPILAENILTLIVDPERAANDTGDPLAPAFAYDSRDTTNTTTLHQLPPRLKLVLVAMDEASAQRLANINGNQPPALVSSTLFQKAANLDADLAALDATLLAQKIGHRVFQREIVLPASAWSNVIASQ